jgi:hypothetical protein
MLSCCVVDFVAMLVGALDSTGVVVQLARGGVDAPGAAHVDRTRTGRCYATFYRYHMQFEFHGFIKAFDL